MPAQKERANWFLTILKWLFFCLGVPGLYVGILSVLPRVLVTPQESLEIHEPLATPFIVSNDGYLDVHSVTFDCNVDILEGFNGNVIQNSAMVAPASISLLGDISAGGRATAFCGEPIGGQSSEGFRRAHITVSVTFRPDFLPWTKIKTFRFLGLMEENKAVRWTPVSK